MQARKDLFQELKSNKTKIARLSFQMSTIRMVRSLSLVPWLLCTSSVIAAIMSPLCLCSLFVCIHFSLSTRNGMLTTNYCWATSRQKPRLLSSICRLSTHRKLKLFLKRLSRPSKVKKKGQHITLLCNNIFVFSVGKITERQKEIESFISEGKDTKMEDSFQEEVEGGGGDMEIEEKGRGRREGSGSGDGDGSAKEQ